MKFEMITGLSPGSGFGSLYSLCILVKEKAGRRSGLAKIKD